MEHSSHDIVSTNNRQQQLINIRFEEYIKNAGTPENHLRMIEELVRSFMLENHFDFDNDDIDNLIENDPLLSRLYVLPTYFLIRVIKNLTSFNTIEDVFNEWDSFHVKKFQRGQFIFKNIDSKTEEEELIDETGRLINEAERLIHEAERLIDEAKRRIKEKQKDRREDKKQ